jgi:glycosyltransferase involved in cell wall biosynthesis
MQRYKIIHVHTASRWSFRRKAPVLLAGRIWRKKLIIHIHGGGFESYYQQASKPEKLFITHIFRIADKIIVLSHSEIDRIRSFCSPDKATVIYNSVSDSDVKAKEVADRVYPPYNILFLGLFLQRKGIFDLLEAMKLVLKKTSDVQLIICGKGQIELVRNYATKLGIEDFVTIPGWVSGTRKRLLLEQGYMLVLPSYIEAFPMSLLEAMAAGLPVITTAVGCVREIVEDEVEGFVIQPGDIQMLSKRMERLLKDNSLWKNMSQAASQKVNFKFSQKKALLQFESLYASLYN